MVQTSTHNLYFEKKHETPVFLFFFFVFFVVFFFFFLAEIFNIVEQACFRNMIVYQFPISLIYFTIKVLKIQNSDLFH